jgi:hypothetical protein
MHGAIHIKIISFSFRIYHWSHKTEAQNWPHMTLLHNNSTLKHALLKPWRYVSGSEKAASNTTRSVRIT